MKLFYGVVVGNVVKGENINKHTLMNIKIPEIIFNELCVILSDFGKVKRRLLFREEGLKKISLR